MFNSYFRIAYRNLENAISPEIAKMRICVFNNEFYNFAQNCKFANFICKMHLTQKRNFIITRQNSIFPLSIIYSRRVSGKKKKSYARADSTTLSRIWSGAEPGNAAWILGYRECMSSKV